MTAEISPASVLHLILDQQIVEPVDGVDADSDLFALGLDSMALMQLLLQVEAHFGIVLGSGDITRERFASARALAEFLILKRESK